MMHLFPPNTLISPTNKKSQNNIDQLDKIEMNKLLQS